MANKHYNVTQHVTINGQKRSSSFQFYGEEAELTAFCNLLEGGYTVTERNDTLSNMQHAETNVTSYGRSNRIGMSAKTADGHFVSANIKPFKGSIIFKDTASDNDIAGVFATAKPFALAPTVTPTTITTGLTQDIAPAADNG